MTGCLTSPDPEASYPLAAQDDHPYFKIYSDVSRTVDVIHNFESKIQVGITHLTPEFRQAMAERYEHIFHESQASLAEAGNKTGFFVSLYAANRELADLADKQLWNVTLDGGGKQKLNPTAIQRLSPKERWGPFFPSINPWSQDFLVLFDLPPPSGGGKQGVIFTLSSPDGSVRTEW